MSVLELAKDRFRNRLEEATNFQEVCDAMESFWDHVNEVFEARTSEARELRKVVELWWDAWEEVQDFIHNLPPHIRNHPEYPVLVRRLANALKVSIQEV